MSDIIAILALVVSIYGLWYSYKIAKIFAQRNEDKMLIDELLKMLSEMQAQASHFFLDNKQVRPNPHIYVASFSSKISLAQFLIHILKNDRKLLQNNIDAPLSDLYLYGTLNAEKANKQKPEKNTEQFSNMDQAYLKCTSIIYQSFQSKYK
ncbi:hypothetical protein [Haemophilus parahaemolyticus]|uniref:hypothetical protein n=1 Tax=Haemophilus parahaemolyticus TaxID=735 RepID=UPI0024908F96|nr:hypothetical protein [Haemophilus parahaemolyticus]